VILGARLRAILPATVIGSLLLVGCGASGSANSSSPSTIASTSESTIAGPDSAPRGPIAPSGFRSVTITITRPDGSKETRCVWIADDVALQERGLMDVTDPDLGGRAGMVFRFPNEVSTAFWMKDTPLPLSIAWFDASGMFVSSADMQPCPATERRCPTYGATGPYQFALEVPIGEGASLGLVSGSRLQLGEACDQSLAGSVPAT